MVAYYVAEREIEQNELITALSKHLPDYMIPSYYIPLDKFPLTVNGKLDRKALPEPEFKVKTDQYVAPRNEIEHKLCELYQSLLGIETVGVLDDFFRCGGNSILAIQLVFRINRELDSQIAVADIFQYKTISGLANIVTESENLVIPVFDSMMLPLSYAQQRMWFIEQYEQGTNAYHIPMLFAVSTKWM